MFKLILHATAKALSFSRPLLQSLSAVALLIVLKVEFNFEVILYTVHYHFCFLNSCWNKTHLKAHQSSCLEGKILHQRGLIFSFCRLTIQPALTFKNIAQQLSQCLHMTRHVYHYYPSEQMGLLKRANHNQGIITASFLTVANKKWRSIELSQISHYSVKQSEIWVRD